MVIHPSGEIWAPTGVLRDQLQVYNLVSWPRARALTLIFPSRQKATTACCKRMASFS